MLLLKDTDQHPDVIAQRKLIELLKNAPPDAPAPARRRRQGCRRRRRGGERR